MSGAAASLAVDLDGVVFPTPVLAASGCFGSGKEMAELIDIRRLGGIVTKSVTLAPARGLPTPRMAETDSGMLNAIGLQNPGVQEFLAKDGPFIASAGVPIETSEIRLEAGQRVGRFFAEGVTQIAALNRTPAWGEANRYLDQALSHMTRPPDSTNGVPAHWPRISTLRQIVRRVTSTFVSAGKNAGWQRATPAVEMRARSSSPIPS